jgi:hypothetical protein
MKSYLKGLITGIVFTISFFLLMAQTALDEKIKIQLKELEMLKNEIDVLGKSMSKSFNDDKESKTSSKKNNLDNIDSSIKNLDRKVNFFHKSLEMKIDMILNSSNDNNGILQDIYTDGIPCNQ